jgi:hypothetical protein
MYSEKATKFCEISTLHLSVCTVDKSKVEISDFLDQHHHWQPHWHDRYLPENEKSIEREHFISAPN